MRSGLWLPLFEELADPGVVARLAAEAEERGWHGVFVWDQLRWRERAAAYAGDALQRELPGGIGIVIVVDVEMAA